MAMLITKFNKLIQSKVVWITFVSLIVIAFVFLYTPTAERRRDHEEAMSAGQLFGKHVTFDEFRNAYNHAYLQLVMYFGEPFRITPELDEEIAKAAWRRLVTLKIAEEMGVRVADEDVVMAIHNHPAFVHEGRFNRQIYDAFLTHFLRQIGFSPGRFEQHVRQEMILQKMERLVGRNVLIAPSELQRAFETVGDSFTIEYARLQPEELADEVRLTEEDVRAHFEAHKDAFMLPRRVKVNYIRFPIAGHLEQVEITEDELYDYYERNLEEFMVYEDVAPPVDEFSLLPDEFAADEPEQDEFRMATPRPFEEVEDEIRERLTRRAARDRALRDASDFMLRLIPDRHGQAPDFAELATKHEFTIHALAPFALDEPLEEIDAGLQFNRMAFDLRDNPNDYFSNVVMGEDYAYIMALEERLPPREPEFEEVAEQVREAARREALEKAIEGYAESFRLAAEEAIRGGETFASAAAQFGIETKRYADFTALVEPEEADEDFMSILWGILHHNEGEITDPIEVNDRLIVAYVEQRRPSEDFHYTAMRHQVIDMLSAERRRVLFEQWQDYMLQKAEFKPREAPRFPDEDEAPIPDVDDLDA